MSLRFANVIQLGADRFNDPRSQVVQGPHAYQGPDRRSWTVVLSTDIARVDTVRNAALVCAVMAIPVMVETARGASLERASDFEFLLGGLGPGDGEEAPRLVASSYLCRVAREFLAGDWLDTIRARAFVMKATLSSFGSLRECREPTLGSQERNGETFGLSDQSSLRNPTPDQPICLPYVDWRAGSAPALQYRSLR